MQESRSLCPNKGFTQDGYIWTLYSTFPAHWSVLSSARRSLSWREIFGRKQQTGPLYPTVWRNVYAFEFLKHHTNWPRNEDRSTELVFSIFRCFYQKSQVERKKKKKNLKTQKWHIVRPSHELQATALAGQWHQKTREHHKSLKRTFAINRSPF